MKIALIDLGTVSVRFEIYTASRDIIGRPVTERIFRRREMLRLGSELYASGRLHNPAKAQAEAVFLEFRDALSEHQPERVSAVATSAFREAEDGLSFVERLSRILGFPLRIISGTEEAQLVARGILANEKDLPADCALLDIGGGSTELSFARGQELLCSTSLPLGAIRGQQEFLKTCPPYPPDVLALREHIRSVLSTAPCSPAQSRIGEVIGSSGTARTLALLGLGTPERPNWIPKPAITAFIQNIAGLTPGDIALIPGMEANRADIILAGSVILEEVMNFFDIPHLRVTLFSLRHGLLAEELEAAAL